MNEYPELKPPLGKFEKIRVKNGVTLLPIAYDYNVLYRGQNNYYNPCLPSIYRENPSKLDVFVNRIKAIEFELLLKRFDITDYFERNKILVDYTGLAQHYGIKTDVLDLTCDIDIALFFAMCVHDKNSRLYHPQTEDKEYVGYVYSLMPLSNNSSKDIYNVYSDSFSVIGLQPFKRPGIQKGFSLQMSKEIPLYGYLYSFSYTRKDSEDIFNRFSGENDIWKDDTLASYAAMINDSNSFTHQAISLAVSRWGEGKSISHWVRLLRENGYCEKSINNLPWGKPLIACYKEDLEKIAASIVQRKLIRENKTYDCMDMQVIGETMHFNILYGGVDAPKGYDSGIEFIESEDRTVYALGWNTCHSPATLSLDMKVCPSWKKGNESFAMTRSFVFPDSFKPSLRKIRNQK